MRFKKCDSNPRKKRTKLSEEMQEFETLNIPYAEVTGWETTHQNAYIASGSINTWAKRNNKPHIKAYVIDKRCYVENTLLASEKEK